MEPRMGDAAPMALMQLVEADAVPAPEPAAKKAARRPAAKKKAAKEAKAEPKRRRKAAAG
jgi:hypothetical protein